MIKNDAFAGDAVEDRRLDRPITKRRRMWPGPVVAKGEKNIRTLPVIAKSGNPTAQRPGATKDDQQELLHGIIYSRAVDGCEWSACGAATFYTRPLPITCFTREHEARVLYSAKTAISNGTSFRIGGNGPAIRRRLTALLCVKAQDLRRRATTKKVAPATLSAAWLIPSLKEDPSMASRRFEAVER